LYIVASVYEAYLVHSGGDEINLSWDQNRIVEKQNVQQPVTTLKKQLVYEIHIKNAAGLTETLTRSRGSRMRTKISKDKDNDW